MVPKRCKSHVLQEMGSLNDKVPPLFLIDSSILVSIRISKGLSTQKHKSK
ncbi:hypothetical protein Hanom_Chr05g00414691 [Helianthus anomalus]